MIDIRHGDCIDVMRAMDDACVDAIVTDPPAGISFMGKAWDGDKGGRDQWVAWMQSVAVEAMRVAKPGAHALVWALPRTSHWTATAWENAGWTVKDRVSHLFGTGFPKSLNVSNAVLDKGACQCRKNSVEHPHVHTLQNVQHPTAEASAGTPGSVLLTPVRGGSEEAASYREGVRDLRLGVDTEGSISGRAQSDVLAGMQCEAHLGAEGGKADGGNSGAAGEAVRSLRNHRASEAETVSPHRGNILRSVMSSEGECGSSHPAFAQGTGWLDAGEHGQLPEEDDGGNKPGMEGRGDVPEQARELRLGSLCEVSAGSTEHVQEGRLCDGAPADNGAVGRSSIVADGVRASQGPRPAKQRSVKSGTLAGQPKPQDGGAWPVCGGCGKPIVPDGLGTALKPAMEDWWLLRKPLIGTVAANVLEHGTGAINIDACRVASAEQWGSSGKLTGGDSLACYGDGLNNPGRSESNALGRWPANVIHDGSDEVLEAFAAFGSSKSPPVGSTCRNNGSRAQSYSKDYGATETPNGYGDSGSPARFFYSAKASKADRAGSKHPTVKPVSLVEYLVRLVTPPGGTVLDPFGGSGTLAAAAHRVGVNAILIEKEAEYYADIIKRVEALKAEEQPLDLFAVAAE
jgi:DNA modification methylase